WFGFCCGRVPRRRAEMMPGRKPRREKISAYSPGYIRYFWPESFSGALHSIGGAALWRGPAGSNTPDRRIAWRLLAMLKLREPICATSIRPGGGGRRPVGRSLVIATLFAGSLLGVAGTEARA